MKATQYDVIGRLLRRKCGATVAEIVTATCTSSPHRRMFEMRRMGWTITRSEIPGKRYGRYHGQPPQRG